MPNSNWKTPSSSSPKGGTRACLCSNNTYSVKCCDGSLRAQGIGNVYGIIPTPIIQTFFILLENDNILLTQNNNNFLKEI